ncbi:MAG: type II secretion system protein GspC [Steroidobacteraceae bacterium]
MTSLLKSPGALAQQLGSLSGPQWVELGARHAPQVVAGLAVVGIAWQAARFTWLVLAPSPVPANAIPTPAAINPTPAASTINPQSIADAHLFGIASAPESGPADPNNLPQTQMNLVLAGTIAMDDPEAGFAIVGETAANAKFYRVGGVINGGPRLHSVYTDRVIIDRNGTLETILLPRNNPSTASVPVAQTVTTPANNVADNIRRMANDPNSLGELLRAQPVLTNGALKGFRIYPGRDRQLFARLGLQAGDLVTSINGTTLDDPNRSGEILNTLTSSTTALLTLERNGVAQQIALDMSQVSVPSVPDANTAAENAGSSTNSTNGPQQGGFGGFNGPGNRGGGGGQGLRGRNGGTPGSGRAQ